MLNSASPIASNIMCEATFLHKEPRDGPKRKNLEIRSFKGEQDPKGSGVNQGTEKRCCLGIDSGARQEETEVVTVEAAAEAVASLFPTMA